MPIEFVDELPEMEKSRVSHDLDKLRTQPGRWANIRVYGSRVSSQSSVARWRKKHTDFEFVVRGCVLYARFVGQREGGGE